MLVAKGRLKIGTRIFIGFGIILAILAGLVWFADSVTDSGLEKQKEYQRRTGQMNNLLESKANLIEVRRAVTLFLLKGGATTEIDKALEVLDEDIAVVRDGFKRQERKDRVSKALDDLKEYKKTPRLHGCRSSR